MHDDMVYKAFMHTIMTDKDHMNPVTSVLFQSPEELPMWTKELQSQSYKRLHLRSYAAIAPHLNVKTSFKNQT